MRPLEKEEGIIRFRNIQNTNPPTRRRRRRRRIAPGFLPSNAPTSTCLIEKRGFNHRQLSGRQAGGSIKLRSAPKENQACNFLVIQKTNKPKNKKIQSPKRAARHPPYHQRGIHSTPRPFANSISSTPPPYHKHPPWSSLHKSFLPVLPSRSPLSPFHIQANAHYDDTVAGPSIFILYLFYKMASPPTSAYHRPCNRSILMGVGGGGGGSSHFHPKGLQAAPNSPTFVQE